tara:strand:+ start:61 stop:2787 length:2727 start_codon:yes stop_codon:yes gene_type:complete
MLGFTPISAGPISSVTQADLGSVALTASATLTSSGSIVLPAAVSMSASATMQARGSASSTVYITGIATLTSEAITEVTAAAALSGSATISAHISKYVYGSCSVGAFGEGFDSSFDIGNALVGKGTLSIMGYSEKNPIALSATATLESEGSFILSGAVSLLATATIDRAVLGATKPAASLMSGPATLTANLSHSISGDSVSMTATATIAANGKLEQRISADMSSVATLSASTRIQLGGKVDLQSSSSILSNLSKPLSGAVSIGKGGDLLTSPSTIVTTQQAAVGGFSWTTAATIDASEFTGGQDYLILCFADIGNNSSTATRNSFQLLHGTTQFSGASSVIESNVAGQTSDVYTYMAKFTQAATPENIRFQIKGTSTIADNISIMAIPLANLTENEDYYYAEDNSTSQHTTSYQNFAQLSFTPTNNNDDWLVIANPTVVVDATNINYEYRLDHNNSVNSSGFSHEGEDSAEQALPSISRVYQLSNGSTQTFTVQGQDDAIGSNDHHSSRIFALRLNKLRSYAYSYQYGPETPSPNQFSNLASISLDSKADSQVLLIAYAEQHATGVNNQSKAQITVDGYTKPTGADGIVNISRDTTDRRAVTRGTILDMSSSKTYSIDFDLYAVVTDDIPGYVYNSSIAAISLALEGVPSGATLSSRGTTVVGGGVGNPVVISASATLSANGVNEAKRGSSDMSVSGTLSSKGSITIRTASSMSTSGVMVSNGRKTTPITITASSSVSANGTVKKSGKIGINLLGTMSTIGSVAVVGSVNASVSATLSPTTSVAQTGLVSIGSTSTITSDGATNVSAIVNMSAVSTITAGYSINVAGKTSLTNTANITGKGVLSLGGRVELDSSILITPNSRIKIDVRNNDIIDCPLYTDRGQDFTLYIDKQAAHYLYIDRERALTVER